MKTLGQWLLRLENYDFNALLSPKNNIDTDRKLIVSAQSQKNNPVSVVRINKIIGNCVPLCCCNFLSNIKIFIVISN